MHVTPARVFWRMALSFYRPRALVTGPLHLFVKMPLPLEIVKIGAAGAGRDVLKVREAPS